MKNMPIDQGYSNLLASIRLFFRNKYQKVVTYFTSLFSDPATQETTFDTPEFRRCIRRMEGLDVPSSLRDKPDMEESLGDLFQLLYQLPDQLSGPEPAQLGEKYEMKQAVPSLSQEEKNNTEDMIMEKIRGYLKKSKTPIDQDLLQSVEDALNIPGYQEFDTQSCLQRLAEIIGGDWSLHKKTLTSALQFGFIPFHFAVFSGLMAFQAARAKSATEMMTSISGALDHANRINTTLTKQSLDHTKTIEHSALQINKLYNGIADLISKVENLHLQTQNVQISQRQQRADTSSVATSLNSKSREAHQVILTPGITISCYAGTVSVSEDKKIFFKSKGPEFTILGNLFALDMGLKGFSNLLNRNLVDLASALKDHPLLVGDYNRESNIEKRKKIISPLCSRAKSVHQQWTVIHE
ncbi:hypothetical protein [Lepidopteran rhabdo-related virus 34]|uniref:Uncharacterized protein n=1 Tax=Lepidopteran rhabdo-related virus 34 TaxID=2847825 RepID=A0A7D7JFT3_9RHAB|nr:hypothetical protein QKO63_gp2 [Lepidopteran rhabdo-related virus 34]QMP82252.1 hypothetical protein [Lepidopteran rhabdo-related virus 34]